MPKQKQLSLLVTGSIAAIKTIPLIKALQGENLDVSLALTRAPQEWKWVSVEEAEKASGHPVLTSKNKPDALKNSKAILVAPASADFLYQLAQASSDLARAAINVQKTGAALTLAPAMNFRMWQHPAVQRNCKKLADSGAVFLGPVKGHQACGDEGYGRMIDVEEMAQGVAAILNGKKTPALSHFKAASQEKRGRPIGVKGSRILVALSGRGVPFSKTENLVASLKSANLAADYVIDSTFAHREALEKLTGQKAAANYYDVPGLEGLEHIRLPERSSCVLFPFIDEPLAKTMTEGRADTLLLGVYLASKAPIVAIKGALEELPAVLAEQLIADGLGLVENVNDFPQGAE